MNKKILICDDDDGIVEVTTIVLTDAGYNVFSLTDSSKVIEKVKSFEPDVILLDLWMPNMSGQEITKLLKDEKVTKDIPIIVFSASKDTEDISKKIGADDFLLKPFDLIELESKVAQFI